MAVETARFKQLCNHLANLPLLGKAPPAPPWGTRPTRQKIVNAINSGASSLPPEYEAGYLTLLLNQLDTVINRSRGDMEPLVAPIYEHDPPFGVTPQLRRFLAVISNLYRSFLNGAKRSAIDAPIVGQLPPLAFFQNDGRLGPYTIPAGSDEADISTLFDTKIGVVSLPSTNKDHPLIWGALAHETGGHDVLHADPGLLPELANGVRALFGVGNIDSGQTLNEDQLLGVLWSYWIDEAASDVYGLLNLGPEFALNLIAFFAGLNGDPVPSLRTDSGADETGQLDPHPTDILRVHLAIGVIENLVKLADSTRNQYIADLKSLAVLCGHGATSVQLSGILREHDVMIDVQNTMPLAEMQEAARRVGAHISTASLKAFGKDGASHSVQEIETWDDLDEQISQRIALNLKQGKSVVNFGDDAQLIAGATLTLCAEPDKYDSVTQLLNDALDFSFQTDPYWGSPLLHPMFSRPRLAEMGRARTPAASRRKNKRRKKTVKS